MEFLKNKKYFYYEKVKNRDIKNINRGFYENLIKEYIERFRFQEEYDFSDAVFFDTEIFINFFNPYKKLIFRNTIFFKRIRFDNIVCKELIFKDCEFLDGGGIKNKGEKALNIEKLIFQPYRLDGDFVIDIGRYASERGIEIKNEGIIEKIEFENNQVGDGRIFFIGLNEYLKKGNFKNRILDNVIFQNCDLRNCYFLNSRVENTEFRNVLFPVFEDYCFFMDKKVSCFYSFVLGIALMIFSLVIIIFSLYTPLLTPFLLFLFFIYFQFFFLGASLVYVVILKLVKKILNSEDLKFLNSHIATADEKIIIDNLSNKETIEIKESLKSLKNLYIQLAINFNKTDKQLAGEFFYSERYIKYMISKWSDFFDISVNKINYFINGFGQRWLRALWHFSFVILVFSIVFTFLIKPNKDYISTPNTPSFLLKNIVHKNATIEYNKSSFSKILYSCKKNCPIENDFIFYGYDNRYNFNNLKQQKIFELREDLTTGFYKSLSNLFYPFSFEGKKWFQNISQKAILLSFLETILLWIFLISFFKALWNRIKF